MRILGVSIEQVQYLATSLLAKRTRSCDKNGSSCEKLCKLEGDANSAESTADCCCVHCNYQAPMVSTDANKDHFRETGHRLGCCIQLGKSVKLYCFKCANVIDLGEEVQAAKKVQLRFSLTRPQPKCRLSQPVPERKLEEQKRSYVGPSINDRGLVNFGKTCYMNSILQVLVHTPMLTNYFISNESICYEDMRRCQDKASLVVIFHKLLSEFRKEATAAVYPKELFDFIRKKMPYVGGNTQHDAHEFFTNYIDRLHTEFMNLKDGIMIKSPIDEIFLGCLESEVNCNVCRRSRATIDPFRDISLEVISNATEDAPVDLVELLTRFTQRERLDDPSDYRTYYLRKPSDWLCFDDAKVQEVSLPETLESEAYVLFYKRKIEN